MSTNSLRDIYLDVADEETITERQEETPSSEPIDEGVAELEESVSAAVLEDGLDDALDGVEVGTSPDS